MKKYLSLALLVSSLGSVGCTKNVRENKTEIVNLDNILNSKKQSETYEITETTKLPNQKNTEPSPRQLEQQALLDIQESVYCIRDSTTYSTDTDDVEEYTAHSSGFVLYKKDGWTYLTSSNHIISSDIVIAEDEEKMLELKMKKSETISIVDGSFDEDSSDDIKLEVVRSDKDLDSIIFRTKADLYLPQPYKFLDSSVKEGDPVYMLGFPEGIFKAVTQGIVSNHLIEFVDSNIIAIDGTIQSGNSGGPIFYRSEKGELYLIGQSMACYPFRGELCGGFLFSQETNNLKKFWFPENK